jgi:hypothetical protein
MGKNGRRPGRTALVVDDDPRCCALVEGASPGSVTVI